MRSDESHEVNTSIHRPPIARPEGTSISITAPLIMYNKLRKLERA